MNEIKCPYCEFATHDDELLEVHLELMHES